MSLAEKHAFDDRVEMYLKSVWELSIGSTPLPIADLAAWLGISTVSATEMVHKLERREILHHIPYKGIELTQLGKQRASAVVRRHKLWECFLYANLGLPWEQVHEAACELEHAAQGEVIDALSSYLGDPQRCPHGNPIPPHTSLELGVPLAELAPGQSGIVLRIYPESAVLLAHAADHGLKPGAQVTHEGSDPLNGPIHIRSQGLTHHLGVRLATHIFMQARGV